MPDDMWRVCDVLWLITEHSVATDSDTDHDTGTCDTCADHDTRTGHVGALVEGVAQAGRARQRVVVIRRNVLPVHPFSKAKLCHERAIASLLEVVR